LASLLEAEGIYDRACGEYSRAAALLKDPSGEAEPQSMLDEAASLRCRYKIILSVLYDKKNVGQVGELASELDQRALDLCNEMEGASFKELQSVLRGLHLLRGNAQYFLGDYENAANEYNSAFQVTRTPNFFDPGTSDAVAHGRLGDCYRAREKMQLAVGEYNRALSELLQPAVDRKYLIAREINEPTSQTISLAKLLKERLFRKLFPETTRQNIAYAIAMETLIRDDQREAVGDSDFEIVESLNKVAFADLEKFDNVKLNLTIEDAVATRLARRSGPDVIKAEKMREQVRKESIKNKGWLQE
jgi:tetratricopeptide (TPR) repeat protein